MTVAMVNNLPGSKVFILTVESHLSNNEPSQNLKQQNCYILFLNNNHRTTYSGPSARPQNVLNPFDKKQKYFLLLEANIVNNIF